MEAEAMRHADASGGPSIRYYRQLR